LAELLTADGDQLLAQLAGREVTPEVALRLSEELRAGYPAGLVAAALGRAWPRLAALGRAWRRPGRSA
jgi:hypothetical protein